MANLGVCMLVAAFVVWTTLAADRPQSIFYHAPAHSGPQTKS